MGTKTVAALSAIIVTIASGAAYQIVSTNRAGDAVRSGEPGRIVDAVGPTAPLAVSLTRVKNINGGWNVAFPRDKDLAAAKYPTTGPMEGMTANDFLARELDDGAYLTEGAAITLEIEGHRNQEITVTNVRPILTRDPVPTGTLRDIDSQGGGGETELLDYDLDSPVPTPTTLDGEDASKPERPFFDIKRITLKDGEKDTLLLQMAAAAGAYSYSIAIDYEYGGEKHTQLIDRGGGRPFRVAAHLCGPRNPRGLSAPKAAIDALRAEHYSHATKADFTSYPYQLVRSNPATLCNGPR